MIRPIAMIYVLAGASFMSFVGVLMRLLDDATGFQLLFYRVDKPHIDGAGGDLYSASVHTKNVVEVNRPA